MIVNRCLSANNKRILKWLSSSCVPISYKCGFSDNSKRIGSVRSIEEQNSNGRQITSIKEQIFKQILTKTSFKAAPSIIMSEDQFKNRKRYLSRQEKELLQLYLPHNKLFKPRMTLEDQLHYKQQICEQLYSLQRAQFTQAIRIMQDPGKNYTGNLSQFQDIGLDDYINLLYKDIYARYLLSKGIGVEWEINSINPGIVTAEKSKNIEQLQRQQIYNGVLQLFNSGVMHYQNAIGLYSSAKQRFIDPNRIEIQNVTRVGHFGRIELTQFGSFEAEFQIAKSKGSKIWLIVFTDYLQKLISLDAICLSDGKMMVFEKVDSNEHYITSIEVYQTHRGFFEKQRMLKKSFFQGKYLVGMKCGAIPIISEIQGYSRKPGLYSVNGSISLGDFQRLTQSHIKPKHSFIHQDGTFIYNTQKFSIRDPTYPQKLHDAMKQQTNSQKEGINLLDMYETFEDQIYSDVQTMEPLHFRTSDEKLVIPIQSNEDNLEIKNRLLEILQEHDFIQESKIEIPRDKILHKPRDRRRFKKDIQELRKQETQHLTLRQSIEELDEIVVSSINQLYQSPSGQHSFNFPLIINHGKNSQRQVCKYPDSIYQQLKLHIANRNTHWNQHRLQQLAQDTIPNSEVRLVRLPDKLIRAILFFQQTYQLPFSNQDIQCQKNRKIISSIIIQPQTATKDHLAYYLMLGMLANKIQSQSATKEQRKGRKTTFNKSSHNIPQKQVNGQKFGYSLIKLHPTLHQTQRQSSIQQIISGVKKANQKEQYGYGMQAMRLWLCRNDNFLGDRVIKDYQINQQIQFAAFLRKLYWQLIPLISNEQLTHQFNSQKFNQSYQENTQRFLDRFTDHHIDYYILNMQHYYSTMNLHQAYTLTQQFFRHYIDQIYLNTVRKNLIVYKTWNNQPQRQKTLARIVSLLGVLAPIIPFSVFHTSKQKLIKWPTINMQKIHTSGHLNEIQYYNRFVKFRVELHNRIKLNRFSHVWLQIQIPKQKPFPNNSINTQLNSNDTQSEVTSHKLDIPVQQLAEFLAIDKSTFKYPPTMGKKFKMKLKKGHPFNSQVICHVYQYYEHCLRCDEKSSNIDQLCPKCIDYIKQTI